MPVSSAMPISFVTYLPQRRIARVPGEYGAARNIATLQIVVL